MCHGEFKCCLQLLSTSTWVALSPSYTATKLLNQCFCYRQLTAASIFYGCRGKNCCFYYVLCECYSLRVAATMDTLASKSCESRTYSIDCNLQFQGDFFRYSYVKEQNQLITVLLEYYTGFTQHGAS